MQHLHRFSHNLEVLTISRRYRLLLLFVVPSDGVRSHFRHHVVIDLSSLLLRVALDEIDISLRYGTSNIVQMLRNKVLASIHVVHPDLHPSPKVVELLEIRPCESRCRSANLNIRVHLLHSLANFVTLRSKSSNHLLLRFVSRADPAPFHHRLVHTFVDTWSEKTPLVIEEVLEVLTDVPIVLRFLAIDEILHLVCRIGQNSIRRNVFPRDFCASVFAEPWPHDLLACGLQCADGDFVFPP
mmetsp:Transcript_13142/g.52231  ORF Transcript_13142/g.52231 Transcript_13142/m.52231 type:complete len:241 (+) Transcript_13142:1644-2366(+)